MEPVTAFATLGFPVAASTFDQTQHGFFVVSACMLAFLSSGRGFANPGGSVGRNAGRSRELPVHVRDSGPDGGARGARAAGGRGV